MGSRGAGQEIPNFFAQRTNSTDIEPPRSAKKTAIVRRTACQSPNSGLFCPVRPRNEVPATPRAPYMLLEDTRRISPIDTRYTACFGVCPSRARGAALWRQRRFRERRAQYCSVKAVSGIPDSPSHHSNYLQSAGADPMPVVRLREPFRCRGPRRAKIPKKRGNRVLRGRI